MHRLTRSATLPLLLAAACGGEPQELESARAEGPVRSAVDMAALADDDGQWVMPARDYASRRFSGLTQITPENVGRLELAWSFSTGVLRGHEAAPIIVNNTLYITTPHPNYLYALDPVTGEMKWRYDKAPTRVP